MSKATILSNLKEALNNNKLNGTDKAYKDLIKHSSSEIIKEYIQIQTANKAIIVESSDYLADIKRILKELDSKKIIYTLDVESFIEPLKSECNLIAYNKSVDETRDELFATDTSIIKAGCGIADVGVFGLASSPQEPRLASLITKNCIVILEKKDIVQSINDGINKLKANKLPSNIIFIAGPSRTADIELKTVFGVHGPQQVYIILI